MANNLIQIKRSATTATPSSLNAGELAFSNVTGGSGVLYIGSTDGGTVVPIGGVRNPGTLTANQALVANSSSGIDKVIVANLVPTKIWANGAAGQDNQYLASDAGGNVYWASAGGLTTNVDSQYAWSNTQSFANQITFSSNVILGSNALYVNTSSLVIKNTVSLVANGSTGSAGQVLSSNGSAVYWSTPTTGDITAVTAGSGLTGGGTSGDVTLDVGQGNGISVTADAIAVTVGVNSGLSVNSVGLFFAAGNGLSTDSTTAYVKAGNSIVISNTSGLFVNAQAIATYTVNSASNTTSANIILTATGAGGTTSAVKLAGSGTTTVSSDGTNITIASADQFTGTVTSVASANGIGGGTITGSGTLYAIANNGIVANSTGIWAKAANGISVDASGINVVGSFGVAVNASSVYAVGSNGINITATGINVTGANGISVTSGGVKAVAYNGIAVDTNGIGVTGANGISVTSGGVKAVGANGISVDTSGINVLANNGIVSNSSGVFAKASNGINVDASGIFVKAGDNTIVSNASGVYVNSQLSITDLTLSGNLIVSGTVTSVNTTTLIVKDNVVEFASNNTTTDVVDSGFYSPAGNSVNTWYSGFARIAAKSTTSTPYYWLFNSNTNPNTATTIGAGATGTLEAYLAPYGNSATAAFIVNSSAIIITANSSVVANLQINNISLSTALAATSGGTGQSSYATGDLLYATGTTALGKLSVPGSAANGQVLQITNNLPAYGTLDGGTF